MTLKRILKMLPWFSVFAFSVILYKLAFAFPAVTEHIYSRGIYPVLTYMTKLFSLLPFSMSELLIYLVTAGVLVYLVYLFLAFKSIKGQKLLVFLRRLIILLLIISFIVSFYFLGWAINYAREPLSVSMGLDASPSSQEELISVCKKLAARANELRPKVSEDGNGVFQMSESLNDIFGEVPSLYEKYAKDYMNLGSSSSIKAPFTKDLLSTTQTMGIFSAFTYECHVNTDMHDLYIPATAAHEYAHLKGFAREDECNFISWYVTRSCGVTDFEYSGTILALLYAMNSLYSTSIEAHAEIYNTLDEGIIRDWRDDSLYWDAFDTELSKQTSKVYDNYLKSNGVSDGNKSYGRMVDLLIAMDRAGLM